jgi:hypothetical protein
MGNNEYLNEPRADDDPDAELSDRRNHDRRKEPCEGYTYVSMVGWICRREKSRRKDDPFFCDFQ